MAAAPEPTEGSSAARQLPKGFYWGTATSSYQIEGACTPKLSAAWFREAAARNVVV